jgi:hypothetical protein
MLIYLAEPMSGKPLYNFPEFDIWRDELVAMGHAVISPADMDREIGFDPKCFPPDWDWNTIPATFDMEAAMDRDIAGVRRCNAVFMMPGWECSRGAFAEHAIAVWCRKAIYCEWDLPPRQAQRETIS